MPLFEHPRLPDAHSTVVRLPSALLYRSCARTLEPAVTDKHALGVALDFCFVVDPTSHDRNARPPLLSRWSGRAESSNVAREEEERRGVPRARSRRGRVRVFARFSPSVKREPVSVKRAPGSLSPVSARSGPGESDRHRRRAARDSPLRAPEIAIVNAHRAHVRDTTREKWSPDHVAAIGAPVHQLVAALETRRNGSPFGRLRQLGSLVRARRRNSFSAENPCENSRLRRR